MRVYRKKQTDLKPATVHQLDRVFAVRKWSRENGLFGRFCEMLHYLDPAQQSLVLELTLRFLIVKEVNEYTYHLQQALSDITADRLKGVSRIYVLPLSLPRDYHRFKSPAFVYYLFKGLAESHELFPTVDVIAPEEPQLPSTISDQESCLFLVVDDFVGTGESAEIAVRHLFERSGISKDRILILCIVAQEEGITHLDSIGIDVVCSLTERKGITDNYLPPLQNDYVEIMRSIEDMLGVDDWNRFGYRGSEALVSMIRTPDNTFPVFRYEPELENGERFTAPFPRK